MTSPRTLEIKDNGDGVANLLECDRADVSDALCDPANGHGSHMLALGGRWSAESVVIVTFDHDLRATAPEGSSERYDLDHVGTAAQDSGRGHNHRRSGQTCLGAGWRTEFKLDDVTRRQRRARQFPQRSMG